MSFRLPIEDKERLETLLRRSGNSLPDVVLEAVDLQSAGVNQTYEGGFEHAKRIFRVTFPCFVCFERVEVATSSVRESAGRLLQADRWGHTRLAHGGA